MLRMICLETRRVNKRVYALLFLIFFAGNGVAALVGLSTFDESSGTVASDSAGYFDGTPASGAAFISDGISGNALDPSRSGSYVSVETGVPCFVGGPFTLATCIKTTTAVASVVVSEHEADTINVYSINPNSLAPTPAPEPVNSALGIFAAMLAVWGLVRWCRCRFFSGRGGALNRNAGG